MGRGDLLIKAIIFFFVLGAALTFADFGWAQSGSNQQLFWQNFQPPPIPAGIVDTKPDSVPASAQPSPALTVIHAIHRGGRIRVEVDGTRLLEYSQSRRELLSKLPSHLLQRLNLIRDEIKAAIEKGYAGIRVKEQIYLIFHDSDSIGNADQLVGYEIKMTLPISIEKSVLPPGLEDVDAFFTADGTLVETDAPHCAEFFKKLARQ